MIKVVIWILFLIFTAYALFCALLYTRQRSLLYYPRRIALLCCWKMKTIP